MGFNNYPFDCSKYIICVRTYKDPDTFQTFLRDCPAGTYWSYNLVTCSQGIPSPEKCDFIEVNTNAIPIPVPCQLLPGPTSTQYYFNGVLRSCPAATYFQPEKCACILIDPEICTPEIFHTPFDDDFNDVNCNKAVGVPTGNVTLSSLSHRGKASACFQGDGFLTYSYFNNILNGKEINEFTIVFFVLSDEKGFFEREGIISQRDCDSNQSPFDITIGPRDGIHATLNTDDGIADVWGKFVPGQWTQVVIRYDGQFMDLLIDGVLVDQSNGAKGVLRNSKCPVVLGWRGITENVGLFRGYVDDVRLFLKLLTNIEIDSL
jgi:hypothetical protein